MLHQLSQALISVLKTRLLSLERAVVNELKPISVDIYRNLIQQVVGCQCRRGVLSLLFLIEVGLLCFGLIHQPFLEDFNRLSASASTHGLGGAVHARISTARNLAWLHAELLIIQRATIRRDWQFQFQEIATQLRSLSL